MSSDVVSPPEGVHRLFSQVCHSSRCSRLNSQPPSTPSRDVQEYLYFIPVSARTVSCSDSPCRCRNFSSCFSSAAGLSFADQPAAGGQALGTTLGFFPFRSASLGFCRLGLWGGMSAQEGLYKCMVDTRSCRDPQCPADAGAWGPQELPPRSLLRAEPSATTLPPVQDCASWAVLPKQITGLRNSIFLPAILYVIAIGSF